MTRQMKLVSVFAMVALFLIAACALAQEGTLEISGVPASRLVASGCYYPLEAVLGESSAECEWSISDQKIARISSGGKLYVHMLTEPKSFTLTASHAESGKTAVVMLTAIPSAERLHIEFEGKNVSREAVRVCLSDGPVRLRLTACTRPVCAAEAVKWTSENREIASVDQNGTVTVHQTGQCLIYAETVNGRVAETTVSAYFSPNEIALFAPAELEVKEKGKIEVSALPEEASNFALTYTSSDPDVISVDRNGNLTARRVGTATVTVKTDNGVSAACEIECYRGVSEIYFRNYITPAVGETLQMNVRVKPDGAKYKTVVFESLNPEIAVVDGDGFVTGVAPGTAKIRATSSNGLVAERNVTVEYMPLEALTQSIYYKSMHAGEQFSFAPGYLPENASVKTLIYESSQPSVAQVDENGLITACAPGRAEITAVPVSGECGGVSISIRVCGENSLPLEGIIVGVNPGHQITRNFTQLPVAPGSRQTKNANSGYAVGVRTGTPEYQVTLDVSLYLRDALEALGATVVMTRTTNDININNIERAQMLNDAQCDIALQIHCDNGHSRDLNGFYAYVKTDDQESRIIAWKITGGVHEAGGLRKNNCKFADTYMSLNWSFTPAILLELGYMSNPDEDVLLSTPEYQKMLADGIVKGLVYYFGG